MGGGFCCCKMILEKQLLIILSFLSSVTVTVTVRCFDFNHSFTEFRPGSRRLAESIRERMLHLDTVGVTGRINFDELSYNHQGILNIYQYFNQNGTSISMKKLKLQLTKICQIVLVLNTFTNFTGGSFTIVYVQINSNIAIGIFVATTLALIFTISAQIYSECLLTQSQIHQNVKSKSDSSDLSRILHDSY